MSIFKAVVASAALTFSVAGVGVSEAKADPPSVVFTPPFFFPRADFRYDDGGYYRTHTGNYYHYDRDRDGWHHGRNHREGMRHEGRRGNWRR